MPLCTEFVLFASQDGVDIRSLCHRFGISPATGYKWLQRWVREGAASLQDHPHIPYRSPNRSSDDITALLRMVHDCHERWGVRKIKRWLKDQGHTMLVSSTVYNLVARHGLLPSASPGIPAMDRFEHDVSNRFWQIDFRGHFSFGGGYCHPPTLLDDHSRFSLCLAHYTDERRETVQQQLVNVFERHGLPDRMTMDNGSPWGDTIGAWTALELRLMRLSVRMEHSWPYHPQTQGKLERFHHSLEAEVLQGKWFVGSGESQCAFDHWRAVYSLERPHEALDMVAPGSRYQPLTRQYSGNIAPPGYDKGVIARRVSISGKLSMKGVSLSADEASRGERAGLRGIQEGGNYEAWWYNTKVGVIDLKKKSITMDKGC